jgi:hypothetical protein
MLIKLVCNGLEVSQKVVTYVCDVCKQVRRLAFTPELYAQYVSDDLNGLALFSDIHGCIDGLKGVNNLHIDHDYNVRSFVFLKLPEYRKKEFGMIPMPSAAPKDQLQDIVLTHILGKNDFNIEIYEKALDVKIIVGEPGEEPISTLESDLGIVQLKFFPSSTIYTPEVEVWLTHFINIIEILPPTKISFLVEVIQYILDNRSHNPTEFDLKLLKTILASHEVFFTLTEIDKLAGFVSENPYDLSSKDLEIMQNMIDTIDEQPMIPLKDFIILYDIDFIHTIYLFLNLEVQKILIIDRPGIVG